MKKLMQVALAILLVAALSGCKSRPASQTYEADIDTTWEAVVKVIGDLGPQTTSSFDRAAGKITTGLIAGNRVGSRIDDEDTLHEKTGRIGATYARYRAWRARISLTVEGNNTRVTVKAEEWQVETAQPTAAQTDKPITVGRLYTGDLHSIQRRFLESVAAELGKKQEPARTP